jgi:hypothetical protein
MWERQGGRDHRELCGNLNNLAVVCRASGKYEAAKRSYNGALRCAHRSLGSQHPKVTKILQNLAELLRGCARWAEFLRRNPCPGSPKPLHATHHRNHWEILRKTGRGNWNTNEGD